MRIWKKAPLDGDLDEDAVLALNNAHATETSPLTRAALRSPLAQAFLADGVARGADAFLIALDEASDYGSPNYAWFKARHPRFVYVDRVITAPQARQRGHARTLYERLFARPRAAGHVLVGCEVNVVPPNLPSERFHRALGFAELERAEIAAYGKTVSYLARRL